MSANESPNYAFLVHSQTTLRHTLPPDVDNESVARQKRRRTSPEDQAILESEFDKNSKPDKLTRKTIAERMRGMGEKEVQIWFQNRRQSIRRRSRPLLPNEVPHLRALDSKDADCTDFAPENTSFISLDSWAGDDLTLGARDSASDGRPQLGKGGSFSQGSGSSASLQKSSPPQHFEAAHIDVKNQPKLRTLKRSLSGKRLSTTPEGAAMLLGDDESSPSPPRKHPSLLGICSTSKLPLSLGHAQANFYPSPNPASLRASRSHNGRSRDSRAWEFWCDTDSQQELAKKAEQEQSGSAAAAIGLMRDSSKRVLGLNASKANQSPSLDSNIRKKRPSLERSKTSMARLETSDTQRFHLHEDSAEKDITSLLTSRFGTSPTGDSDKENNDPHRQTAGPVRRKPMGERPQPDSKSHPATLKDNRTTALHSYKTKRSAMTGRYRSRNLPAQRESDVRGAGNPENDAEIASFMGGGPNSSSVTLADAQDMDVVQGLLSLSKG